jgi:hypothetical protein
MLLIGMQITLEFGLFTVFPNLNTSGSILKENGVLKIKLVIYSTHKYKVQEV